MKIKLSPDDGTGGTPITTTNNAPQIGTSEPVSTPPPPTGAPPTGAGPAGVVIVTGTKSERELELEREAEELRRTVKDRERAVCELQDKHENYRKSVEQQTAPKRKKVGAGWFESDEEETEP